jgi:hypothetical protein
MNNMTPFSNKHGDVQVRQRKSYSHRKKRSNQRNEQSSDNPRGIQKQF